MLKESIAVDIDMKVLASIHGETVDHHLTKQTVVLIGFKERLDGIKAPTLTEIAVDRLKAWSEQAGWYDKHIGKDIDNSDIYDT